MAQFSYKAADQNGRVVTGTQDASDEKGVVAALQAQGYIPIRITPGDGASTLFSLKREKGAFRFLNRVSDRDVLRFTEDLATLLGAGLTLDRSLQILRDAANKQALKSLIAGVLKTVQKGGYLSDALADHPGEFSQFYVNMVKAGEAGGFLDLVLERMSTYLRDIKDLKDYIISAMIYPLFLVCIGGISILVLLTYVIPKFAVIFEDLGQTIPLSTQLLLGAGAFFQKYVFLLLAVFAALIFFWHRFSRTTAGRTRIDSMLTRLPVVGGFVQELETARFARTLGTLIKSGVPILGSLTAAQMITVGEETGRLDEMLFKIGDIYEIKVRSFIKRGMSLLEPVVILGMGILVGFIVISMLMAIFSMNDMPF
jgi:general secretion pathway protein F